MYLQAVENLKKSLVTGAENAECENCAVLDFVTAYDFVCEKQCKTDSTKKNKSDWFCTSVYCLYHLYGYHITR